MIPKLIHFIWLGSEVPSLQQELHERCARIHPDWEVKVWGEEIEKKVRPELLKRYRAASSPAAKADIARFCMIYELGGFYLDSDFVVLKSFEPLRKHNWIGCMERAGRLATGFFGSIPEHSVYPIIWRRIKYGVNSQLAEYSGPGMLTSVFKDRDDMDVLPPMCFYSLPFKNNANSLDLSQAYAVHLWHSSWLRGHSSAQEMKAKLDLVLNEERNLGR